MNYDDKEREQLQSDRAMGLRAGEWIDGDGHRCPLPCAGSVTRETGDAGDPAKLARAATRLAGDIGCGEEAASAAMEAALSATQEALSEPPAVNLKRIIRTLDWLVLDCCWRTRVDRPDGAMYGDDENYSPELRDAIALLADLRRLAENGE